MDFPKTVNKIAWLGDLHCNYKSAQKAVRQASKQGADVIIQVGDFAYNFPDGYLNTIETECERFGILFLFIDGNHDNFDWLYDQPVDEDGTRKLRPLLWHLPRGFRWEWNGVRFLALGGAHSVDRSWRIPGAEWWYQEYLTNADLYKAVEGGNVDVMVTHDAPTDAPVPLGDPSWIPESDQIMAKKHRELLQDVVDIVEPRFLIHGHYHNSYAGVVNDVYYRGLNMDGTPWDQCMAITEIDSLKDLTQ